MPSWRFLLSALLAVLLLAPSAFAGAPTADSAYVFVDERYEVELADGTFELEVPIDLLAFASDPDGEPLAFSYTQPVEEGGSDPAGNLLSYGSGLVVFRIAVEDLDALPQGASFTYTVEDPGTLASTGKVIVGRESLLAPVGVDDSFDVATDAPTSLPVLDNDSNVDSIASFTEGIRGTVTLNSAGDGLVFDPAADFAVGETDTFTYVPSGPYGEGSDTQVTVTGIAPQPTPLEVERRWDTAAGVIADGEDVAYPYPVATDVTDSVGFDLRNRTGEAIEIVNATAAVSGECFSVTSGEPIPDEIPVEPTEPDEGWSPAGFRLRLSCPTAGTKTATVTLQTQKSSGAAYAPFTFTVTAEVVRETVGPTGLRVLQGWDDVEIADGSTLPYPNDAIFEYPTSFLVKLENPTAERINITNADSAISGSGFGPVLPGAPVPDYVEPGTTEQFRVKFYWDALGDWTGTVTLETETASGDLYEPFSFDVTATLVMPEVGVSRGWPGADQTPIVDDLGTQVQLPIVAEAGSANNSVAFHIRNVGAAGTVFVKNADATLVDGECFEVKSGGFPEELVPVNDFTPFRVWWGRTCGPGTYTATVAVDTNAYTDYLDPIYESNRVHFTIVGEVSSVPELTCQPSDARVVVGESASFTVCAADSGETYTYEWFKDGQPIAGSGPTLSLSSVTDADEGSYHAEVTSPVGTATSASATLTVVEKPVVSQPQDRSAPVGGSATFSVNVSSPPEDGPFSYQWQKLPPGASTFQNISGANSASLTVSNLTLAMDGTFYRCLVSNDAGQTNPGRAKLTVDTPAVQVTRNWDGVVVSEGSTFDYPDVDRGAAVSRLFRITNTGDATLTISNPTNLVSGTCWSQIEDAAATVPAGGYTTFRVRLQCSSAGTKTGTVTINSDEPDTPYTFTVRGTVVASNVVVKQNWDNATVGAGSTIYFGSVETGVATSKRFKITNNGQATLTISNPTNLVSGTCWSQIENAASSVAPGATTYFRVRLLCSSTGTKSGTVTINSNDPSSPYRFYVQGTVNPPPPGDVSVYRAWNGVYQGEGTTFPFPDVEVGDAVSRRFRITNTGSGTLTISNPTNLVSGSCWSQIENAASSVAPGASTYFRVRLQCSSAGSKTGTITIYSNDTSSPYRFYVSGTVNAPEPGNVAVYRAWNDVYQGEGTTFPFPDTSTGSAVSRRFKITNTGAGTLTISNPSGLVSGTCWSQIENAASSVAPGASTYFRVRLLCSTTGTKTGTITIYSNDTSSPYRFYVQGTVQ